MRINTSRDLVRYHDARAALFAAFAAWLAGQETPAPLPEALDHRARRLLPPHTLLNRAVQHIAEIVPSGTRDALRVLSFLSAEVAEAFRREQLFEAAAIFDAERAFMDRHGARLLTAACSRLDTDGDPAARAVGASLRAVLDDDEPADAAVGGALA